MSRSTFWTDEAVVKLHRLAAMDLSASEIADQLGTTRSAVIGRCWRFGPTLSRSNAKLSRLSRESWSRCPARERNERGQLMPVHR